MFVVCLFFVKSNNLPVGCPCTCHRVCVCDGCQASQRAPLPEPSTLPPPSTQPGQAAQQGLANPAAAPPATVQMKPPPPQRTVDSVGMTGTSMCC